MKERVKERHRGREAGCDETGSTGKIISLLLKKYTLQTIPSTGHTWQGVSWNFGVRVLCFTCKLAHCQNSINVDG